MISVIIALIFFAGANVIRTQLDLMSLTAGRYSLQTLSDRQITIWNDPQKAGTQDQYHPAFSADIQEKIRAVHRHRHGDHAACAGSKGSDQVDEGQQ